MSISHVQTFQASPTEGASAASRAESFLSLPIVGNIVTVCFALNGATPTPTCADNQGNTYTLAVSNTQGTACVGIYWTFVAVSSGTFTVTIDPTGSAEITMALGEYSGFVGAPSVLFNSDSQTGTAVSTGAINPGTASSLYLGCMSNFGTLTTIAPNGSYTERAENEAVTHVPIAVEDIITTGSQTPTWTLGASRVWIAAGASFTNNTGNMFQVF